MIKINSWKIPIAIILLALSISLITGCSATKNTNTAVRVPPNGETQTVKLSVDSNYIYSPQEIKTKAGTKLVIDADPNTNVGGMDTVIIEGYGINKKITPKDNRIEFIADTPGTFNIHCANGMGDGKLIVE